MSYTSKLADFAINLKFEEIPEDVVHNIKRCILDTIGYIIGASIVEEGKMIADFVRELGDREEATVLGFNYKSSCRNAAFANGTMAEVLEAQDGYRHGGNHPCSTVIPATLAVGEYNGVGGKDLITAVTVGYEVANRISRAMHPSHTFSGFLPTGTTGTFATAAAIGNLLGIDNELMINAFGIAQFLVPLCASEANAEGYTVKTIQGGQGAKVGVTSAMLAKKGFTGCPESLAGSEIWQGGFCNVTSDNPKFERIVEDLGEEYTIRDIYYKPFTSCRHTHGAAEATLGLVEEHDIKPENVKEVLVKTYSVARLAVGKHTSPSSSIVNCQFSIPYVVAAAITDRAMSNEQLTKQRIRDPKIHEFVKKIKLEADPELDKIYPEKTTTQVEIITKDDKKYIKRVELPKGDPRNPITDNELLEKFERLAHVFLSPDEIKKATSTLMSLEKLDDISKLMEIFIK